MRRGVVLTGLCVALLVTALGCGSGNKTEAPKNPAAPPGEAPKGAGPGGGAPTAPQVTP